MAISSYSVDTLRRKVSNDQDLSKIWLYFLDHFVRDPAFSDAGRPCAAPELESALELAGRTVWGKPRARLERGLWLLVSEFGLTHGTCMVESCSAYALYFREIKTGVAGFHTSRPPEMVWARFSPPDLSRIPIKSPIQ